MKFRTLIFLFIAMVVLTAWFTKPDYDDFIVFQQDRAQQFAVPPVIDYSEAFLFSKVDVTYYASVKNAGLNTTQNEVAVPVRKESFIGLFSRFWELK